MSNDKISGMFLYRCMAFFINASISRSQWNSKFSSLGFCKNAIFFVFGIRGKKGRKKKGAIYARRNWSR